MRLSSCAWTASTTRCGRRTQAHGAGRGHTTIALPYKCQRLLASPDPSYEARGCSSTRRYAKVNSHYKQPPCAYAHSVGYLGVTRSVKRRCFNRDHEVLLDAQLPGQCVDSFDRFMPRATKETNYDYYIPAGQGRFHKLFLRARMFENRHKSLKMAHFESV